MRSAALALMGLVVLASSCSVYSEDLVDGASANITGSNGGDAPTAGRGQTSGGSTNPGGNSSGDGGNGSVVPGAGGEPSSDLPGSAGGNDTSSAGTSGTEPNGGTSAGGNAGSGNSAGNSASAGSGPTSGGTAGAGGLPVGDLIDGFEDEDITLEQNGGRGGVWYLFDDATVGSAGPSPLTCTPLSGAPKELGGYAMHITATGFTAWGSGLGVDFRAGKKVYDAGKYSGIRFWAKVGTGKNTRHRLQLADATTDKAGGKCNPALNAPDGAKCDDHFGINEIFTTTWTEYIVKFSDLSQIGWGNAAPALDKSALYGLQITAKPKLDVDLWLDQIEFF
jgi:hypothetical protein